MYHLTRVVGGACCITNVCCGSNNPLDEQREDYRERPLTSEHGGGDTCDLGNFIERTCQHTYT